MQGRQLLLQRHVRGLHGIEPPLQHARLMARVAQLRLQRLDRPVMLRVAPIGPLRRLIGFPLELRDRAPLTVDLEQRAFLGGAQALFGPLRRLAQFLQIGVPVIFVPFTGLGASRRDKALRSAPKIISF